MCESGRFLGVVRKRGSGGVSPLPPSRRKLPRIDDAAPFSRRAAGIACVVTVVVHGDHVSAELADEGARLDQVQCPDAPVCLPRPEHLQPVLHPSLRHPVRAARWAPALGAALVHHRPSPDQRAVGIVRRAASAVLPHAGAAAR
uniref:Uncharacterized protein n=1 Tax=Triticum urartu TaxID=4572 RepID=A0A8R7VHK7_TRIUA